MNFDMFGWLDLTVNSPQRYTDVVPPTYGTAPVVGQPWPNFTGAEWVMVPYVAPVIPVPVIPPNQWPAFDFYRKFTAAQRIAIRTLANTDPVVADFMHTLDSAIASGTSVIANDPDLTSGLAYLTTALAGNAAFPSGWAAALVA